jgi:hypothetical protein
MIQIKRGSTRIAIVIAETLVIKIPHVTFLIGCFTKNGNDRRLCLLNFLKGVLANVSEFYVYISTEAPFLTPVFSLGLVTFQRYEIGDTPTQEELGHDVLSRLPERTKRLIATMDPHDLDCKNWRRTWKGYRLIDYGDSGNYYISLPMLITRYEKEISEVVCR